MRKSDVLDLSSAFWVKNAPIPASLASTRITNSFEKSGKCNTGRDDNAPFDWVKTLLLSWSPMLFKFLPFRKLLLGEFNQGRSDF